MNKGKRVKRSMPKPSQSDVGVCGTGRNRVINVNPHLLTPSSAAKLHTTERKRPRHEQRSEPKIPGTVAPLQSQHGLDADAIPPEDLPSSQTSLPTYFYSHPTGFQPRQLSKSTSMTGSELSLSSTMATDDVSSIADSEITDISECGMNAISSNGYLSDMTLQASPLPMNSTWAMDTHNDSDSLSLDRDEVLFHPTLPNTSTEHSVNELPRIRARLERTIEISPTLMLPVTSVGGGKNPIDDAECMKFGTESISREDSLNHSETQDAELSSNTSAQLENSLQSDFLLQNGNKATGVEDDNNTAESNTEDVFTDSSEINELQVECNNLRQSLKLADADIAILVSSKQQLQLKFHEEKEKNGAVSKGLIAAEEKISEYEGKLEDLLKSVGEKEEAHEKVLADHKNERERLEKNLEATQLTLDVTRAERDSKRVEAMNLAQCWEACKMQIKQMKRELEDATAANVRLETLVQEASSKDEGNDAYISHLKVERNGLTRKLQEFEQENMLLQIKNKTQESKVVDLQHANKEISDKVSKFEVRSRETEAEKTTLSARLQTATNEKTQLNAAVARLRSDMTKVETSFSRLKQQMIEKSRQAESEASKSVELEKEVKRLSQQLDKHNNLDAETRLRDKNVQIEQLLTKSRISTSEKTRMEKTTDRLQALLTTTEKSWAEAVEREKKTSRLLSEKERLFSEKEKEHKRLYHKMAAKTKELDALQESLEASKKYGTEFGNKLTDAEQRIENLVRENTSISAAMEQLRKELHDKDIRLIEDGRRHKEMIAGLQNDVIKLNTQVEAQQLSLLSKEEELKLHKSASDHDPDPHMMQQMELLSELQSARRELSQEKDSLLGENEGLKVEIQNLTMMTEELNRKLSEAESNEKRKMDGFINEMNELKRNMEGEIGDHKERVKETEKLKSHLEEELKVIKDHNNILSQQLGALQTHNHKLSDDLQLKIKELEDSGSQTIRKQEEMEILKQELSNVTFQLSEALQANSQLNGMGDMENVVKERDLLKDAVVRQQQYTASLQKHYENWAKEASTKMREEVSRIRIAAEEERSRLETERNEHANMLEAMEKKMTTDQKSLVSGLAEVRTQSNPEYAPAFKDSSSQTEHSMEPLIPWSQKYDEGLLLKEEMMALKQGLDAKHSDALKNEGIAVIDAQALMKERDLLKDTVLRQQSYTVSLQNHYDKWARDAGDKMKCEITNARAMAEQEKRKLVAENCSQGEIIASLQDRIQELTVRVGCLSSDADTQTNHDDAPFGRQCEFHKTEQVILEDSSTQTDHSKETVGAIMQSHNKPDRELEKLNNYSAQMARVKELETMSKSLQESRNLESTDAMTQTNHDRVPLYMHSHITPQLEVSSTLLEDSFTQTSHDEEPLHVQTENVNRRNVEVSNLEDSSTQTCHDVEPLNVHAQEVEMLAEELLTLKKTTLEEKSCLAKENTHLMQIIADLKKKDIDLLADKSNSDSSTQTGKEFEELPSCQTLHDVSEDASTQTEHDDEPITPLSPLHLDLSSEMSGRIIAEEEKVALEKENINMATKIIALEKLNALTSVDHQNTDCGTQTSHDEAPLNTSFELKSTSEALPLLEDSSTQTDHLLDPVLERDERLKTVAEERDSLKHEVQAHVKQIEDLNCIIRGLSARTENVSAYTQTANNDTTSEPFSGHHSKLTEEMGTQTDHSEQPIVPWSQEADEKIRDEICMVRKLAEEEMGRLLHEKVVQAEEITNLKEKLEVLSSHKHRLADSGTQTGHAEAPLHSLFDVGHIPECCQSQADASSQTSHDLDPVVPISEDFIKKQLKEELEFSKQELSNISCRLSDALEENERLATRLEKSKALVEVVGTQTTHDDDPICLHSGLMEVTEVIKNDASSQTCEQIRTPVAVPTTNIDVCTAAPLTNVDMRINEPKCSAMCENYHGRGRMASVDGLTPTSSGCHAASQTDILGGGEVGVCPLCGDVPESLSECYGQLPSPMTILKTMESRKLKAYKKTVHLLKKKLQMSENKISDLQAELQMLSPAPPVPVLSSEVHEDPKLNDEQELYEQNRRAMAEIKLLQNEIYETKKSSALQAEDRRRKALADRKKLEAKIANMSDRISGLTETNKRLRDSVQKLQVKLAEKTKVADMSQKEKQRYQLRARRLQASLRSLAWITGKQQNPDMAGDGSEVMLEEDGSVLADSLEVDESVECGGDAPKCDGKTSKKPALDRSLLSLPASVTEIEESLRDLQSEIIALERQMQEHNSAVKRSKSHWARLNDESHQDLNLLNKEDIESTPSTDHIDKISRIV